LQQVIDDDALLRQVDRRDTGGDFRGGGIGLDATDRAGGATERLVGTGILNDAIGDDDVKAKAEHIAEVLTGLNLLNLLHRAQVLNVGGLRTECLLQLDKLLRIEECHRHPKGTRAEFAGGGGGQVEHIVGIQRGRGRAYGLI